MYKIIYFSIVNYIITFVTPKHILLYFTMINIEDFISRLQKIIDYYGESASSFAEKVGVQRSSISHILSGRNKPSLDFVLKILAAFPDVDMYWLCNGKGDFPKTNKTEEKNTVVTNVNKEKTEFTNVKKGEASLKEEIPLPETKKDKTIDRIVIFYADGSFKSYNSL